MTTEKTNAKETKKVAPKAKSAKTPSGKYTGTTGKRKAASAQVRLYANGTGAIVVNGKAANEYFTASELNLVMTPLRLADVTSFDVSALVNGGGKKGQAEAIRHGIAKALVELNAELRPAMKAKGYMTRDARIKERKKPGLKKARKAPQWSKR